MSISRLSKRSLMGGRGTIEGMSGQSVGIGDPYWNQTVLAMHLNSLVDLKGGAITVTGSGAISSTKSKFGGSSYYSNGGTGKYLSIPTSSNYSLSSDYTVECWLNPSAIGTSMDIIDTRSVGATLSLSCSINAAGQMSVYLHPNSYVSNNSISANVWTHLAWIRVGNIGTFYINGVASGTYPHTAPGNAGSNMKIGSNVDSNNSLNGYLQDLRITRGVARYTTNFTPPERTFPTTQDETFDPYFAQTALLIRGEGANNAGNTVFVDSSVSAHAITRSGDVSQGTFSPFPVAAGQQYDSAVNIGSAYFDGTGDWITTPNTSDLSLLIGDWTVEAWVNPAVSGTYRGICGARANGGGHGWCFYIRNDNNLWTGGSLNGGGYTDRQLSTLNIPINTWTHVAMVKYGSTLTGYVNGVVGITLTGLSSGYDYQPTQALVVGALGSGGEYPFTGYITNLHIIKGYAKYTANFAQPSAPATPSVTPADPYDTNVSLYLPFNGDFLDTEGTPFTVSGPTLTSSIGKSNGQCALFNSGRIYATQNAAFNVGANPFTLEFWIYPTTLPNGTAYQFIVIQRTNYNSNESYTICFWGNNATQQPVLFIDMVDGTSRADCGVRFNQVPWAINTWYHVAISRVNSTTFKTFVNGVAVQTASVSSGFSVTSSTADLNIGSYSDGSSPAGCYMDEWRLTKGVARYTADFTPPTYPGNTALLLRNTNASIRDETGKSLVTPKVNAKIQTAQSKWGSGALYFDGSSYCEVADSTLTDVGLSSQPFTIEAWTWPNTLTPHQGIIAKGGGAAAWNSTNGIQWDLFYYVSNTLYFQWWNGSTTGQLNVTIPAGNIQSWHHVAVSYDGVTARLYYDGVLQVSAAGTFAKPSSSNRCVIGASSQPGGFLTGYVQDVRITKTCRYQTNFTPPARLAGRNATSIYSEPAAIAGPKNKFSESNKQVITEDVTMDSNLNYLSAGPVTINTGNTVTVSPGSQWVVI